MSAWKIVLFCLGLFVGAGVSARAAESTNADSPPGGRIVVLGDSITAGYGLDPMQAYPALLQEKVTAAGLKYEVVNAGVSGDTTSGGLRRIDWALKNGAAVLVIALGGNDGLRGIAPPQTEQNLAGIIRRAREKAPGVRVIVAGMEMPGSMGEEYVNAYRELFPRVAKANEAKLVPFLLEGIGGLAEFNQQDMIHPNPAGQEKVAENVWKVLQPVLTAQAGS